jgi:hypothetical protein
VGGREPAADVIPEPARPVKKEPALPGSNVVPQPEPPLRVPSLYVPLAQAEDRDHRPRQITVFLRPTEDQERNKRRIKSIHGTLTSFPGNDRFSFQIFENGKGHLIDFPNNTTRICPEMLDKLKKLMGEESWRVEEITFQ